jgi:hypothetical protein
MINQMAHCGAKDPNLNSFLKLWYKHKIRYSTARYLVMEIQYVVSSLVDGHNKMKTPQKLHEDL